MLHQIFSCVNHSKCAVSEGPEMQLYQSEKEGLTRTEIALVDVEGGEQDVPIGN